MSDNSSSAESKGDSKSDTTCSVQKLHKQVRTHHVSIFNVLSMADNERKHLTLTNHSYMRDVVHRGLDNKMLHQTACCYAIQRKAVFEPYVLLGEEHKLKINAGALFTGGQAADAEFKRIADWAVSLHDNKLNSILNIHGGSDYQFVRPYTAVGAFESRNLEAPEDIKRLDEEYQMYDGKPLRKVIMMPTHQSSMKVPEYKIIGNTMRAFREVLTGNVLVNDNVVVDMEVSAATTADDIKKLWTDFLDDDIFHDAPDDTTAA